MQYYKQILINKNLQITLNLFLIDTCQNDVILILRLVFCYFGF